MPFFLIAALVIAGISILFSLQNTDAVLIQFLFWSRQSPLVLVLLITLLSGVVVGILIALPSIFKQRKKTLSHKKTAQSAKQLAIEMENKVLELERKIQKISAPLKNSQ